MTVAVTSVTISYIGDGVTDLFTLPFPVLDGVEAFVDDVAVAGTLSTDKTQFQLAAAPANGAHLRIDRATRAEQEIHFADLSKLPGDRIEAQLDRITMVQQEQRSGLDRFLDLTGVITQAAADAANAVAEVLSLRTLLNSMSVAAFDARLAVVEALVNVFGQGVNSSNYVEALNNTATVDRDIELIIPVGTGEDLTDVEMAVRAVAEWNIPTSSTVILQLKDETLISPGRIAVWKLKSPNQVILSGMDPLVKTVLAAGHSSSGTQGDYSVTFKLADVTDLRVGGFLYNLENDEFLTAASDARKTYISYDQVRPRWVFTEIQAATPNSSTFPEGFVRVTGTLVEILVRDTASSSYTPSTQIIASDYITAGEVFYVNGQMRGIDTVSTTGPEFTLVSALDSDLGPQTYWYTLINKAGTFEQTGTSVTGVGTQFTDFNVGDFHAHDGMFNPITAITSDTQMTVAVGKTQAAGANFSIIRNGGVFGGAHPVTAIDVAASTVTIALRGWYDPLVMDIPLKGITGGRVRFIRSVLETTGGVGGITVEGDNFIYQNVMVSGPQSGIGIDPRGQNENNTGTITLLNETGGTYGFNIGQDFGAGCTAIAPGQVNWWAKFACIRNDYGTVRLHYGVQGGSSLYGWLTNGATNYGNWTLQNGNKSQGYLAATPSFTVCDTMTGVGNLFKGVTIQAAIYHLVQYRGRHNGAGPSFINSSGRATGTSNWGGKLPLTITGGTHEGRASTYSGFVGNGVLFKGANADILRTTIIGGSGGAGLSASNHASIDFSTGYMKDCGSCSVSESAHVQLTGSNLEVQAVATKGGMIDAANMLGTFTGNIAFNTLQADGAIIRT